MRKAILGAASALIMASPAVAADLSVTRHSEIRSYEREFCHGVPVSAACRCGGSSRGLRDGYSSPAGDCGAAGSGR